MTTRDLTIEIHAALRQIAPEIDPAAVDHDAVLVEALDLDSMDFLNFLEAVSDRVGIDLPEADYPRLRTLAGIATYLRERAAATA